MIDLKLGDCLDVMKGMPAASVDAIVTDPPSGIHFMGADWDHHKGGRTQWVAWLAERMGEAARVVKPGHYALVWALPRTSHWTACALEDAGWTLIERVAHVFGTGFPKSKARLKPAVEDWWLCRAPGGGKARPLGIDVCRVAGVVPQVTQGVTSRASEGQAIYGQGRDIRRAPQLSNPSPAGRFPPNLLLTHSPACVPAGTRKVKAHAQTLRGSDTGNAMYGNGKGMNRPTRGQANPHTDPDGTETVMAWECDPESCPVRLMDEQAGERKGDSAGRKPRVSSSGFGSNFMDDDWTPAGPCATPGYVDGSNVSRFFPTFAFEAADFFPLRYVAKASKKDRGVGNTHPTVKPLALMSWLCRLVTPPGGTILDPFLGSGTTGLACRAEGFGFVGIEQSPEYHALARARLDSPP